MWIHRTDLIAGVISRSSRPYKVRLGSASFSKGTLTLKNLTFQNDAKTIRITRISLTGPLSSWLLYLFVPNQTTLNLDTAVLSKPSAPFSDFDTGNRTFVIHLKTVLFQGDQTEQVVHDFTGSIPEILALKSS